METNYTKPKTKKYAVIGITAGLLLGAGGGLLMNLPGGASADSARSQAVTVDDNTDGEVDDDGADGEVDDDGDRHGGRGGDVDPAAREAKLRETLQVLVDAGTIDGSEVDAIVTALSTKPATPPAENTDGTRPDMTTMLATRLQPLVDAGTLTTSQRDAVVAALVAAGPSGGGHGGGHGDHRGPRQEMLTTAAEAIGITVAELKTALQGGQTMAEVAVANGKTAQSVIDALVAQGTSKLTERITDMVNGVHRAETDQDEAATS